MELGDQILEQVEEADVPGGASGAGADVRLSSVLGDDTVLEGVQVLKLLKLLLA